MTDKYKLMMYFVVATIHFYRKGIVIPSKPNVDEFKKLNPEIEKRVFDEG